MGQKRSGAAAPEEMYPTLKYFGEPKQIFLRLVDKLRKGLSGFTSEEIDELCALAGVQAEPLRRITAEPPPAFHSHEFSVATVAFSKLGPALDLSFDDVLAKPELTDAQRKEVELELREVGAVMCGMISGPEGPGGATPSEFPAELYLVLKAIGEMTTD